MSKLNIFKRFYLSRPFSKKALHRILKEAAENTNSKQSANTSNIFLHVL